MKAMALFGKEDIREIPLILPEPKGQDLIIKIIACGLCGSDLRMYFNGPTPRYKTPIVLGHEIVGKITETGPLVDEFACGDIVTIAPIMPCKRCPACIEGNDNLCEKGEVIGCTINGGFSEDMFIPEQMVLSGGVVKVPNQIDPLSGTLTEILACCYHGINLVNFKAGERALIIGDGPIGLTFVQLTKLMGASYVVTTGHRQIRKELSKKLGADEALDAMDISNLKSAKEFFNLVVVATSNTDVISDAIDLTKSGGHILLFSGYSYGTKIEIDPNKLHYREIQLHGSIDATIKDFYSSANLLPYLRMGELISKKAKLSKITDAFQDAKSGNVVKIVVSPD